MNIDSKTQCLEDNKEIDNRSKFAKFIANLCPCFIKPKEVTSQKQYNAHQESKTHINREKSSKDFQVRKQQVNTVETLVAQQTKQNQKRNQLIISLNQIDLGLQKTNITRSIFKKQSCYPINFCQQNKFIILGKQHLKLLAKVTSIKFFTSQQSKSLLSKAKKHQPSSPFSPMPSPHVSTSNLDKYWDTRYEIFSKFDQGISITEQCWPALLPELISEYIAGKVRGQVVNLGAGVGCEAIKLANTCAKVWAVQERQRERKAMRINCKIYCAQNVVVSDKLTQQILKCHPEIALLSPNFSPQYLQTPSTPIQSFPFALMPHFKNLILILPPNIEIESLSSHLVQLSLNKGILSDTCCMTVEKVYYEGVLRCVVVWWGEKVNGIAINDQLEWIYGYLGVEGKGKGKGIGVKRVVKKVRESYGMFRLLNFIMEANGMKQGNTFDNLIQYLKKNNLISQQILSKLLAPFQASPHSPPPQPQLQPEIPQSHSQSQTLTERTNSYVSTNSINRPSISIHGPIFDSDYSKAVVDPHNSVPLNRIQFTPKVKEGELREIFQFLPGEKEEEIKERGQCIKGNLQEEGMQENNNSDVVQYKIENGQ